VLDPQHWNAELVSDPPHGPRERRLVGRVQAGTRFVEEEQSRLHRQGARQSHELLLAERQRVGARVAQGLKLQELQDWLDSRALCRLFATEPVEPR
jgi:hypothetical protein